MQAHPLGAVLCPPAAVWTRPCCEARGRPSSTSPTCELSLSLQTRKAMRENTSRKTRETDPDGKHSRTTCLLASWTRPRRQQTPNKNREPSRSGRRAAPHGCAPKRSAGTGTGSFRERRWGGRMAGTRPEYQLISRDPC